MSHAHHTRCSANCILSPHILKRLLASSDAAIRESALTTLLATTALRAERQLLSRLGFLPNVAGEKRRTIYDCKNRADLDAAELVRSEQDGDTDDVPVDRAFAGLGATYDFYEKLFDRNSIDGRGMRIDGYVRYRRSYNNAFWNGRQMVFGEGDGRIFTDFTASLDVIAHELTHGVTEFTAGLEYHNESGALNESVSDVFGSLVKQWSLGQSAADADWLIGADIFTPEMQGDALRSMKDPGHAYDSPILGRDPQPAHMENYERLPDTEDGDWGGVHINSGIPNHAFYLAAIEIGGNAWDAPGHIWYEALRASNVDTNFEEFAGNTSTAAGRLYGAASDEQRAITEAWRQVGVRVRDTGFSIAGVRDVGRTPALRMMGVGKEPNGRGNLARQIEAMAGELRALRQEVDQIKQKGRPTAAAKA